MGIELFMTLKVYIWGIRAVTLFSIGAFAMIASYVDPNSGGIVGKVLFFSILFFALGGIFHLILLWLRRKITVPETVLDNVGMSFRQGMLLAFLSVGMLTLQGLRMLVWWGGLLLVAGVFLIELFFLSRNSQPKN